MLTSGQVLSVAIIEQLITRRVAEVMAAYEANQNNQNGNGNPNVNIRGVVPVARECTYQDFMKCQPLNFKGTEGVVGLTRWFEKMENVFHISNCPKKYQVKYASCTLQDSALTWWNSHKRTIGTDAGYSMPWKALMKLMTEVYCPRNKIQKMETELWNLAVKEEDRVEKFIGSLPNNIQGNVIAAEPIRLQDVIRIANNLMDQKLKGYTARNADNKRRFDNDPRDNCVQQPPFKRQNVARAYTIGNNKNKGYAGILPLCDKCKLHHHGPCPVRCGNCKKVGHQARDCWASTTMTCYRCGGKGNTKRYCP
ncbi:putative reverse transcriptase domain-containing protein [Tanacetum coccineum]